MGSSVEDTNVSESDNIKPPDTSRLEGLVEGAKAFLGIAGAVAGAPLPIVGPILGSSFAEAIGWFGQREVKKRQDRFLNEVVGRLEGVQSDVANLKESFWSTLFDAIQIALRTHQQEKLDALTNAVVNAAGSTAPDDDMQHIFVNMVDELTPLHLRLLTFLLHPERFGMDVQELRRLHAINPSNPRAVWDTIEQRVAPRIRRDVIQLCFNDMVNRGLLGYADLPPALQDAILPRPTDLAQDFLGFITAPTE